MPQKDAKQLSRTDVEAACSGPGNQLSIQTWQLLTRGRATDTTASDKMLMSTTDSGASSDSLNLLDADFVDLRQVRRVVGEVYAMRDNLAQTLMNANSIADSLTASFSIFLRILLVFAALWTLNVDVYALWIAFSSSLVALAFVFGGVMKEYFESAVFLFSVHPYDVGDWIVIGEKIQLGSELARAAAVTAVLYLTGLASGHFQRAC